MRRVNRSLVTVLLADPPWPHANGSVTNSGKSPKYPLMTFSEIEGLSDRAKQTVGEDGVLYLWATVPHLPMALKCMESWGFKYRSWHVWAKKRVACGYWARSNAELLLIGERGFPQGPVSVSPSVVTGEPWGNVHSAKPDEVYDLIERAWPESAKVEWFARRERPGWVQKGGDFGWF